ncbi:MAG: hypothetical protein DWH99_10830 [Planctomycetota bacterium]|nr:MAG: hypothetical protein DWH99_10830 [Planctomycetota bacterium]
MFFEKAFSINVTNTNEVPTNVVLSSTSIVENAGVNGIVGSLSTADPDVGNTFTYSLEVGAGDADNSQFNISGSVLRATSNFDFETKSSYTVRIRATDQGGLYSEASFDISVIDANDPPMATSDSFWVSQDQSEALHVLDNDLTFGNETDKRSVEVIRFPFYGIATPIDNGSIRYTPINGFRGDDFFTYRFKDTAGQFSDEAIVSIRVNTAPVAKADFFIARAGKTIAIDVLGNDIDPDGTINPEMVSVVTLPSYADVVVQVTGKILFTSRTGFLGDTHFQYIVSDNEGRYSEPTDISVIVVLAIYQNPSNKFDVDNDGSISPLDVLLIINLLNAKGASISVDGLPGPPDYVDVNGDNHVDPLDVLETINFINSRNSGRGEGEDDVDYTFSMIGIHGASGQYISGSRESSALIATTLYPCSHKASFRKLLEVFGVSQYTVVRGRTTSIKQRTANTVNECAQNESCEGQSLASAGLDGSGSLLPSLRLLR